MSASPAPHADQTAACPRCGKSSRVGRGLCLNCLLQAGVESGSGDQSETLDSVLAEIDVRDADWQLGNYQILEEIGRGGMGVIYRARQRHSRRIVALKRILSYHADSRETLIRFRREAQAAASLDHPNILPIYEVGEGEDGLPFFTMKFASGGSLLDLRGSLRDQPREVARLMAKVTRAVQYAHSQGILHRDLKPGNILLDSRGEPMVTDFGLAKWLDQTTDLTRTLTVFGTPGYIAPEQASGAVKELKPAADIYSIGAVVFDLLAGRPPFLGEHALAVIKQANENDAPKLRSLVPKADRDLETICAKCLERDAAARYQSAHDLASDFERYLEGRPILARPVSLPVNAWRWAKRNPILAGAFSGCLLLAGVAIIWPVQHYKLATAAAAQQHSVALLPFLDLDAGRLDEATTRRVGDLLRADLARIGPARVEVVPGAQLAAAEPNVQARDAAEHRHTRTVLTGSYRMIRGQTRLTFRLLDADGDVLVRETINSASLGDAGAIPVELAAKIYSVAGLSDWTEILRAQQDPVYRNERARNYFAVAQDLAYRQNLADIDRGIDCLRKSIEAEPRSALARATFSRFAGNRNHFQASPQLVAEARQQTEQALKLNPGLGDAHRAACGVYVAEGRLTEAQDEITKTLEVDGPTGPTVGLFGNLLKVNGRPDVALSWFNLVKRWENRPADLTWMRGDCWSDLAEDERAAAAYQEASELHPELPEGWLGLCRLKLLQHQFMEARDICESNRRKYEGFAYTKQMAAEVSFFCRDFRNAGALYRELVATDATGGGQFYGAITYRSALGRILLEGKSSNEGHDILRSELDRENQILEHAPTHPEVLYRVAALEASLGDTTRAWQHLRAAIAAGWIDYRSLALDPRFDNLAHAPEFPSVCQQLSQRIAALRKGVVPDPQ